MKLPFTNVSITRTGRPVPADGPDGRPMGDGSVGKGMELAVTVLLFGAAGWLLDRQLGIFPVFTIALLTIGSIGIFVKLKYDYDATMERLQAERSANSGALGRRAPTGPASSAEAHR